MRKVNSFLYEQNLALTKSLKNKLTLKDSILIKEEFIWNSLKNISLSEAIEVWLSSLNNHTSRSYKCSISGIERIGLISLRMSLQDFSLINHNVILDAIKQVSLPLVSWSEGTKQVRAACYISLTKFLNRVTSGIIPVAKPSIQESNRTFYKIRDLVKTNAMNKQEWLTFLSELRKINYRDWLIAQTILQGAKRVTEVLSITVDNISFDEGTISFQQSKSRGVSKTIVITYPQKFMNLLKEYIGDRKGFVFVTRTGNTINLKQLAGTFAKAGIRANIAFKITPHVLRATAVTEYKKMGCADSDIMKVTGHTSSKMIYAYDKSTLSDNASKKVSLI